MRTAFVEYRPDPRTSITLDRRQCDQHAWHAKPVKSTIPNRARPGSFVLNESRERNRHLNFGLTVKRTFGGARASEAQPAN